MRRYIALVPWPLLAALQLCDIATTAIALNTRAAAEGNASAAHVMQQYGQPLAYVAKAGCVAFVILALYHYRHRLWARVLLTVGIVLSLGAVTNNIAFLLSPHA